jgi:hypothetical protein
MTDGKRITKLERDVAAIRKSLQDLEKQFSEPGGHVPRSEGEHRTEEQSSSPPLGAADSPITTKDIRAKRKAELPKPRWIIRAFRSSWSWGSTHLQQLGIWFAIGYAVVTALQWWDQRENFKADQRSWVAVDYGWPSDPTSQPFEMRAGMKNVGKSVITDMYIQGAVEIVDATSEPSFRIPSFHVADHRAPIFPTVGGDVVAHIFDQNTTNPRGFDQQELEGLRNGSKYLALHGIVVYRDHFGWHWFRFCNWHYYRAGGEFNVSQCVYWNTAGDELRNLPYPEAAEFYKSLPH